MIRNKMGCLVFALTVVLAAGACAKKTGPQGAAAGANGSATDTAGGMSGTEVGASGSGAPEMGVSFPVVYFDYNQSVIRSEAKEPLRNAAESLKSNTKAQIAIEGHCDERGSSEYNLALGERRAQSVKSYLRTLGVDGKRLSAISYGKERPVDPGHTEEAWAKNRRAELIVNR
jgi:peptidoglycan-associated lipoprotein